MYKNLKILAIIPARAGSKGLPNKNKRLFCGKPLIQYSIECALSSAYIDNIVVTSDDLDILKICNSFPITSINRPKHLSDDLASTSDVVKHVLTKFPSYDYFTLLQPTSPLRLTTDIDESIQIVCQHNSSSCVSISRCKQTPYSLFSLKEDRLLRYTKKSPNSSSRRQDQDDYYFVNGSIYTVKVGAFNKSSTFIFDDTSPLLIPQQRTIDIDNQVDFDIASLLFDSPRNND